MLGTQQRLSQIDDIKIKIEEDIGFHRDQHLKNNVHISILYSNLYQTVQNINGFRSQHYQDYNVWIGFIQVKLLK